MQMFKTNVIELEAWGAERDERGKELAALPDQLIFIGLNRNTT